MSEQQICIKVWIKLEHSSAEIIWMIQKAAAMGNWWLAASSLQRAHSCITSCAEFFGELSNHQVTQPRCCVLGLLVFPKIKITFERKEISDHQWDSRKYDRTADGDWENHVRSQGTYFKGDWGVIVLCSMFLVSCIFFINVSIFHITWLDSFWTDLVYENFLLYLFH